MMENNQEEGVHLWSNLSEDQQKELLISFDESFDNDNLISHEEAKRLHEKWLTK